MKIAIHQPNFFPWLGYFHKIISSDKFIFLDDVQLIKKGGSYTQRVAFNIQNESRLITVDLSRPKSGTIMVSEARFLKEDWYKKFLKTIKLNYSKHPFFDQYIDEIETLCINSGEYISTFNMRCVTFIADLLGVDASKFTKSSSISEIETVATERLIDLTKSVKGTAYIEGGGASGYQNDCMFERKGIQLIKQNFRHPVYPQRNSKEFVGGLSALDALFNIGHEELLKLLKNS